MAAGGVASLPAGDPRSGGGKVTVGRGRGTVIGVVVGVVTRGGLVTTVVCSGGRVTTGFGGTVVVGAGVSSTGAVVVVAEGEEAPEPELDEPELDPDDDELDPDEAIDATGATPRPERSGTLSGGVGSGGLAFDM